MKFVFVLEDDVKFQKQIVEAIESIDSKIEVRLFTNLDGFLVWIRDLAANGPSSIVKAGVNPAANAKPISETEEHRLVAIVSKLEFLGARQIPLLKKTRNMFVQKKVCTAEDPTAFVLTTFEAPNFQTKQLEDRIINNVIMKPFDRLILAQHLTFAIDGRHKPSKYSITNQKMETVVEMLKDVKMESWSEVGFLTRSDRKLDAKHICSKYYGDIFKAERKTSIFSRTLSCDADPKNPDQFICSFSYFGLGQTQISSIRRRVQEPAPDVEYDWTKTLAQPDRAGRPLSVVILEENETQALEIQDSLRKRVKSVEYVHYISEHDFFKELDPQLLDLDSGPQKKAEPAPAFPKDNALTFVFDEHGTHLLSVTKAKPDPVTIWGVPDSEFRNHTSWWTHHLPAEQVKQFRDWLVNPGDLVLSLAQGKTTFYFKPTFREKDEAQSQYKVNFQELTAAERNEMFVSKGRVPRVTDLVIYSHRFLKSTDGNKWTEVSKRLKARSSQNGMLREPLLFVLSSKDYTDPEMREWGSFAQDIFFRPLDRVYFLQKLKLFFPEILPAKDAFQLLHREKKELISTANPVRVTEISEAGLVMDYYRPISPGGFREFVLWQAYELGVSKVLGSCNHSEESGEKGVFRNHFVFFAIADHFLKAIRIWIRENYILTKEKES